MKSFFFVAVMTGAIAAPASAHHKYTGCDLAGCAVPTFSSLTSDQPVQVIQHQQSPAGQEQQSPE